MKPQLISSFLSLLVGTAAASGYAAEVGEARCGALLSEAKTKLQSFSYDTFDQVGGSGWRKLYDAKCFAESASLIGLFSESNVQLSVQQMRDLSFHRGQALALGGNSMGALAQFERCFRPQEDQDGFRWNAYLRGSIAFLRKDMDELVKARDDLKAHSGNHGNQVNLAKLENFVKLFSSSYAEAYSAPRN